MKIKSTKKWLAALLAALMVMTVIPVDSHADPSGNTPSVALGISALEQQQTEKWQKGGELLYFGRYSGNGAAWRLLNAAEGVLFLDSDFLLPEDMFGSASDWTASEIRTMLNGDGFYNSSDVFSSSERNSILSTQLQGGQYSLPIGSGEETHDIEFIDQVCTDYIFLLSAREAFNFYADDASRLKGNGESKWWLRSLDYTNGQYVGGTSLYGWVNGSGSLSEGMLGYSNINISPALRLNAEQVLLTSSAQGGKVSGETGEEALTAVQPCVGNEWKLTLLDGSRNFSAALNSESSNTLPAGGRVLIDYSGARDGEYEYVSAVLCDSSGRVLYYGNIAGNSESGTAAVCLPAELAAGSYTLKVFSEQRNGDYMTDYASAFQNIALDITLPQEMTPEASFTAVSDNGGTLTAVDASMKYSIDGGETWHEITGETMDVTGVTADHDIKIYKPGNGITTADSEIQTIDVTQAYQPEGLDSIDCTTNQQNDGQITGVSIGMEYKRVEDSQWTAVTGSAVTGLADGIYEVRVMASGTVLASPAVRITVNAHVCTPSGDWQFDEKEHWKLCSCGARLEEGTHSGGTATCTDQAVCEICKTAYGELNASRHSNLIKIKAKPATSQQKGNIAYWYCDGCGKYFKDEAGAREITLADTVIPAKGTSSGSSEKKSIIKPSGVNRTVRKPAKSSALMKTTETRSVPKTGDENNLPVWFMIFTASGIVIAGSGFCIRKRKK